MKLISIIIPVYNETVDLKNCLIQLEKLCLHVNRIELVISTAGEFEDLKFPKGFVQIIKCESPGRGKQMNAGSKLAKGEILYFLHADSLPPKDYDNMIEQALADKKVKSGCFRLKFDSSHPILIFYSYFSRFKHNIFHGGDASLFVSKKEFEEIGGYNENMKLMEDYDIIKRLKKRGNFALIKSSVITSSRKYKANGILRLQCIYLWIQIMYRIGCTQEKLFEFYHKHIK